MEKDIELIFHGSFNMIEKTGDIWEHTEDYMCVTTNGWVTDKGLCVMGRGVALDCKTKYPEFPKLLGTHLKQNGNIPMIDEKRKIITFPTKHFWRCDSDIMLIMASAYALMKLVPSDKTVAITRVGCGNGKLNWEDVKPKIEKILDDRFVVYHQ